MEVLSYFADILHPPLEARDEIYRQRKKNNTFSFRLRYVTYHRVKVLPVAVKAAYPAFSRCGDQLAVLVAVTAGRRLDKTVPVIHRPPWREPITACRGKFFSNITSKPIDIRWIRTGSQSF